jgi:hypothetical protein
MIERLSQHLNSRKLFSVLGICAIVFVALFALAQGAGVSAGGKWLAYSSEDKMTAASNVRFELPADNEDNRDDASAKILLFCSNGKFKLGDFRPNTRIAGPDRPSFWGRPQMEVLVRADNSHSNHGWNWVNGHFLSMDKGTTREMLGAQVFKVEMRTPEGAEIASFSPAGLDLGRVSKACGLTPKKP